MRLAELGLPHVSAIGHVAHAVQLALGGVFLASVAPKVRRPRAFVETVREYRLLPRWLVGPVAGLVIGAEAALAASFLTGVARPVALALALVLVAAFAVAVSTNLRRGRRVPCGCFGSATEEIGARTLARIGLLAAGVVALGVLVQGAGVDVVGPGDLAGGLDAAAYGVAVTATALFLALASTWALHVPELRALLRPQDGPLREAGGG